MFDVSKVNKRYFEIKLTAVDEKDKEHSITIEVEPPKIKALKKLIAVSKSADKDAIDDLAEAVRSLLSKNKSKYKVSMEYIDALDFDELQGVLLAYFNWVSDEKKDPN